MSASIRSLFVGEHGVGKTSLVRSILPLVHPQGERNVAEKGNGPGEGEGPGGESPQEEEEEEEVKPTVGIELKTCWIHHSQAQEKIKVEIWDSAGRERFRSIAISYLKPCGLIFLVYDVTKRESFDKLSSWISQVEEQKRQAKETLVNNGDSIEDYYFDLVLVANKVDSPAPREVTTAEGETCASAHNMKYYEVSCISKENIPRFFEEPLNAYPVPKTEGKDEKEKEKEKDQGKDVGNPAKKPNPEKEEGTAVLVDYLLGEGLETVLETVSAEEVLTKKAEIEKTGFVLKKGHFRKNWKQRWLVLKDEYLYYFENEKSPKPKGFILLRGAEISRYQDAEQPDLGFKIVVDNFSTRHGKYYITGLDPTSREEWMTVLKKVVENCKVDKAANEKAKAKSQQKVPCELVLLPGYILFRKMGFSLFKKSIYGKYTTRNGKLILYSDPLLGEERFLLADSAEYGTRFVITPVDSAKVLEYLQARRVTRKDKIPVLQVLDLFNYTYLNACQTLCIVPIQKVKMALADNFTSKTLITSLTLDNISLVPKDLLPLTYALDFVPMVTSLDFTGSSLSRDVLKKIYELTSHPRAQISTLILKRCFAANSGVGDVLAEIIKDGPFLRRLDLSENPLGEREDLLSVLSELSRNRNKITTLLLDNTDLGDHHCPLLGTVLENHTSLSHISLTGNKVTATGGEKILAGLNCTNSVVEGNLEGLGLSEDQHRKAKEIIAKNLELLTKK